MSVKFYLCACHALISHEVNVKLHFTVRYCTFRRGHRGPCKGEGSIAARGCQPPTSPTTQKAGAGLRYDNSSSEVDPSCQAPPWTPPPSSSLSRTIFLCCVGTSGQLALHVSNLAFSHKQHFQIVLLLEGRHSRCRSPLASTAASPSLSSSRLRKLRLPPLRSSRTAASRPPR